MNDPNAVVMFVVDGVAVIGVFLLLVGAALGGSALFGMFKKTPKQYAPHSPKNTSSPIEPADLDKLLRQLNGEER